LRRRAGPSARGSGELNAAYRGGAGIAWIGLYRPDAAEFATVAAEFGLHPLPVEDVIHAHQRPKLERYGDMLFLVLRPARYVDQTETVEFGEVHVFAGQQYVIPFATAHRQTWRRSATTRGSPGSPAPWI
jgi:magnesium transporter